MNLTREQLYAARRPLLGWTLGAAALAGLTAGVYPSIEGQAGFEEMVEDLPPAMRAVFGLDVAGSILSPSGYLQGRLFASLLPVLLVALAVSMANRFLAASERDGTLELTVTGSLPRAHVAWQLWLAMVLAVTGIGLVTSLVLAPLLGPFGLTDGVTVSRLVGMHAAVVALAIVHGSIALGVGAATGSPGSSTLIAGGVAALGYVVSGLADVVGGLRWAATVLPWHWYRRGASVAEGVDATAVVPALVVAGVVAWIGIARFVRRDLRLG
jgi:ABC-2 type transport system permease protein